MLRTIAGVIVGYLIFGVSAAVLFQATGQEPHAAATTKFMVGSIIYGIAFGFVGGLVAAIIARRREAALAVAIIIAAGAIVSMVARAREPKWSSIAALVLMAPAAGLGGVARGWRV